MTTLEDRPGTALLVVDVQRGVVAAAHDRDTVVANIAALAARAHEVGIPVIWVQQNDDNLVRGTENWQLEPSLPVAPGDTVIHKQYGDSFEDTELESVLAERAVGRLIVTGAQTDACIRSTLHGAFFRGYDTLLVSDAHTTEDLTAYGAPPPAQVIAHTNLYWTYQTAPGRTAGTATTKEVTFTP